MVALEYAKNNTLVCAEGQSRHFFITFFRKNRKILEFKFDSLPRLTLSRNGLLAVTTRNTVFYDLDEERLTKPKFEKEGVWHLSSSGEELFTIVSQNNPVKDSETGKDAIGLIGQHIHTNKIRIVNEQLKQITRI
jgi:hypothetical protein